MASSRQRRCRRGAGWLRPASSRQPPRIGAASAASPYDAASSAGPRRPDAVFHKDGAAASSSRGSRKIRPRPSPTVRCIDQARRCRTLPLRRGPASSSAESQFLVRMMETRGARVFSQGPESTPAATINEFNSKLEQKRRRTPQMTTTATRMMPPPAPSETNQPARARVLRRRRGAGGPRPRRALRRSREDAAPRRRRRSTRTPLGPRAAAAHPRAQILPFLTRHIYHAN